MLINFLICIPFIFSSPEDILWTVNGNPVQKDEVYQKEIVKKYELWALKNLKTGDIIFRSGSEVVFGVFDFSKYVREITLSDYSHCGLILRFGDKIWIFDQDRCGTRKVPFSVFIKEAKGKILIKRIRPEYQDRIWPAITYAWDKYIKCAPFDFSFRFGDDELYCAELVCNSYKKGKLLLENPLKAGDQPGIDQHIIKTMMVIAGSYLYCEHPFSLDMKLYTAAGISKSKYLTTIYEGKL